MHSKKHEIFYIFRLFLFAFLIFFEFSKVDAQCINSFPYTEDFETNPSWTIGGSNADWAWGTPNHTYISSAGGGNKSWSIGGLNGSSYNDLELAYIQSPCFDFSNLDYPWISFKVFWETEYKWDGAVFQYSLNNGASWQNLGANNEPANCMTLNWYNYGNITWLTSATPKHGWSGRTDPTSGSCTGGNGSEQWLTAKHCMSQLAGEENVIFRFLFGSGNTCNDFDGFAIDDILIDNNPPSNSNFSHICLDESTVSFTNLSTNCSQSYLWNFGDPNSGAQNTATSANPIHTFSSPGTYTVSLQASSPCSQAGIHTQIIKILDNQITSTDVSCFDGNDGTATVSGSASNTFSWNTTPIQTSQTISNLIAGTYQVTVNEINACPLELSRTVSQPTVLVVNLSSTKSCENSCTGSLNALVSGGTQPYSYSWIGLGNNQSFLGLCPDMYSIEIQDNNSCTIRDSIAITAYPALNLQCEDLNLCIGSSGFLQASGADFYTWSPATGLNSTTNSLVQVDVSESTTYELIGRNSNLCQDTISVQVTVSEVFSPQADFTFSPLTIDVYNTEVKFQNLSQNANSYFWKFSSLATRQEVNPEFTFPSDASGNYTICLLAENDLNCKDSICKVVRIEGKTSIFIPNSFTPDNQGENNLFEASLNNVATENFEFQIYNRWGEIIFSSKYLDFQWDGTYKNEDCPLGVYTWKMTYLDLESSVKKEKTGFVNLLR